MTAAPHPDSSACWPGYDQQLLVKVVLFPEDEALAAWREWRTRVDFEEMDYASLQLIPRVNARLAKLNVDDPARPRMAGIHKQMWFANNRVLQGSLRLINDLQNAGIQLMTIKGAGLLRYFPGDIGLRPMQDVDVLVEEDDVPAAIELIRSRGWHPRPQQSFRYLLNEARHRHHGWNFSDGLGDIDLHWHASHQDWSRELKRQLWTHAEQGTLGGLPVQSAAVTEQILLLCLQGLLWEPANKAIWITDIAVLLDAAGDNIDWDRLLNTLRRRRMTALLQCCVNHLERNYRLMFPRPFTAALRSARVSLLEKRDLAAQMHPLDALPASYHDAWIYMKHVRASAAPLPGRHLGALWRVAKRRMGVAGIREMIAVALIKSSGASHDFRRLLWRALPGRVLVHQPAPSEPRSPAVGRRINIAREEGAFEHAEYGWSKAESDFVWSEGHESWLVFDNRGWTGSMAAAFSVRPYLSAGSDRAWIDVLVNGEPWDRWEFPPGDDSPVRRLLIPARFQKGRHWTGIAFQVPRTGNPFYETSRPDERWLGLCLHWLRLDAAPTLAAGRTVDFREGGDGGVLPGTAWSYPEAEGTWSVGRTAALQVPVESGDGGPSRLMIQYRAFGASPGRPVDLEIVVNGVPVESVRLEKDGWETIRVKGPTGDGIDTLDIEFHVDPPASPKSLGVSEDTRELGIMLRTLTMLASGAD
jgi:hypothetical protein